MLNHPTSREDDYFCNTTRDMSACTVKVGLERTAKQRYVCGWITCLRQGVWKSHWNHMGGHMINSKIGLTWVMQNFVASILTAISDVYGGD